MFEKLIHKQAVDVSKKQGRGHAKRAQRWTHTTEDYFHGGQ